MSTPMTLNGEKYLFDTEQAKSSMYRELYRLPLMRGSTVFDYARAIHTERPISRLYFIHDGEGDLDLTQNRPFISCVNDYCWAISWNARGISGDLIVYGN